MEVQVKKRGPEPKPDAEKKGIIAALRGTEGYRAWMKSFAKFQRDDVAHLIDDALFAFAKERGFDCPPRR